MNLAKIAIQNGVAPIKYPDRKILIEVCDKARLLTLVPDEERDWREILAGWCDEEPYDPR